MRKNLAGKASWEEIMLEALRGLRTPSRVSRVPFEPVYQVSLLKRTIELALEGSDLLARTSLPAWLDRRMPNVDIEGEGLLESLKRSPA